MSGLNPLSVGVTEAARATGVGRDRIRTLIDQGVIRTVPHLSTPAKHVIAVAELERIVAAGITTEAA